MNEAELRNNVVVTATKYVGLKEGDSKHLDILNTWNKHYDKYRREYTMKVSDPWCMCFVSAIFIKCGLSDLIVTECGCGEAINRNWRYKENWTECDSYIPKQGDIIMYDWDDSGEGDCTGWPEHTGIVASCDGKNIQTIEGNVNDSVQCRYITVDDRYIRGYIVPNFASKSDDIECYGVVNNCYSCYVRTEPNIDSKVIGVVHGGDVLPVIKLCGGWWSVKYGGMLGYVSSKYCLMLNKLVATGNVYLREGAGTRMNVIAVINRGDLLFDLNETKTVLFTKWYKVYYNGQIGWCSSKYLEG